MKTRKAFVYIEVENGKVQTVELIDRLKSIDDPTKDQPLQRLVEAFK